MKITLLTPLQNGLDRNEPGDMVDLPKAAAQQLIDCAAAVSFDAEAAKAAKAEAAEKAEALLEAEAAAKSEADAKAAADDLSAKAP